MKILFIGLIISIVAYTSKIIGHTISSISWVMKPNGTAAKKLKDTGQVKWVFVLGGIEYWIIFGSLIVSTLLLYT